MSDLSDFQRTVHRPLVKGLRRTVATLRAGRLDLAKKLDRVYNAYALLSRLSTWEREQRGSDLRLGPIIQDIIQDARGWLLLNPPDYIMDEAAAILKEGRGGPDPSQAQEEP